MKRLTALLLCCLLAAPAPALDRKPRNPRIDAQTAEPGNEPDEWQLEEPARTTARPQTAPTAETAAENPAPATAPIEHRMPELTAEQADSLVAEWRERQRSQSFREFFDTYVLADSFPADSDVPDSVYTGRLRALASPIQLPYNGIVRNYINRYVAPGGSTIGRILGMSQYYFPLIEEELIKEGLPVELRALPIIESGLSSTAVSHAGAAGLWQFMPSTGRSYGLEVNSLVDERCDPILSTKAACRYLKDLYRIYKEWSLAIAAYNCGPGNVNKALARAGEESRSFWDIYDYLPR
ncbi:MAG: transglycosylase SLT domain-containing protein, partial [Alistipes sp.]|nr:transglycosylase SLT domain-containing protein [Alistipes sp.]